MADLYKDWKSPGIDAARAATIITTTANDDTTGLHDQVPVIVEKIDWAAWIGNNHPASWSRLQRGTDAKSLPFGKSVSNLRNDALARAEPASIAAV